MNFLTARESQQCWWYANSILIKNDKLEIKDIGYLKRDPLFPSILTTGLLVYGGTITAGFGVIIGIFVDKTAYLLTMPAAGMIYAGIKSVKK